LPERPLGISEFMTQLAGSADGCRHHVFPR
jgi:hypothetical protein